MYFSTILILAEKKTQEHFEQVLNKMHLEHKFFVIKPLDFDKAICEKMPAIDLVILEVRDVNKK